MSLVQHNAILAIGGAEDKVHGRENSASVFLSGLVGIRLILALFLALSRDPIAIAGRYRTIFEDMGATAIEVMDIRDRSQGEDPSWKTVVESCTGVFITGGDQVRLCGLLADTPLVDLLRQRAQLGEMTPGRYQRRGRGHGPPYDCRGRQRRVSQSVLWWIWPLGWALFPTSW